MDYRLQAIFDDYPGGEIHGEQIKIPCPGHNSDGPSCQVRIMDDKIVPHCWPKICDQSFLTKMLNDKYDPRARPGPISPQAKADSTWIKSGSTKDFQPMEVWKPKKRKPTDVVIERRRTATYWYRDTDGSFTNFCVVRYDDPMGVAKKVTIPYTFRRLPDGREEWIIKGPNSNPWYGLEQLTSYSKQPILIVEGEKCVDVAKPSLGTGFISLGWYGGSGTYRKVDLGVLPDPDQVPEIILWPDADSPGQKWAYMGEENLYDQLTALGYAVRVVIDTEHDDGRDIADIILSDGDPWVVIRSAGSPVEIKCQAVYDSCAVARALSSTEDELKVMECGGYDACAQCHYSYVPAIIHPIQLTNKDPVLHDWAYIENEELFCDLLTGDCMKTSAFKNACASLPGYNTGKDNAVKTFLESPLTLNVRRRDFIPGKPMVHGDTLNLWKPLIWDNKDVEPSAWLKIGRHVFHNDIDFDHVLNYLAYMVQHPENKINHALLIQSATQGIGKNVFFRPIMRAFKRVGQQRTITNRDLTLPYNGWLMGTKLLEIEELNVKSDKLAVGNTLKDMCAAPPDDLSINQKFGAQINIMNIVQLIVYTNFDKPIRLEETDRRWYVVMSQAKPLKTALSDDEIDSTKNDQGIDEILSYLSRRDVSAFRYSDPPPVNTSKQHMIETSAPYYDIVMNMLEDDAWPLNKDIFTMTELEAGMKERDIRRVNRVQLAKTLRQVFKMEPFQGRDQLRVGPGKKIRPWIKHNVDHYQDKGDLVKAAYNSQQSTTSSHVVSLVSHKDIDDESLT